jgi:hypothetical protein
MKDKLKKLTRGKIILAVIAVIIAGFFVKNNYKYTVVEGEQNNGLGRYYGYKVENYSFSYGMRITIWERIGISKFLSHSEMQSVYDLQGLTVDKVGKSEWIKSNGAIYLRLQITYHDSLESSNPTRIIYDFHTGNMYITSDLNLWRIWSDNLSYKNWVSKSEFDKILAELRQ